MQGNVRISPLPFSFWLLLNRGVKEAVKIKAIVVEDIKKEIIAFRPVCTPSKRLYLKVQNKTNFKVEKKRIVFTVSSQR